MWCFTAAVPGKPLNVNLVEVRFRSKQNKAIKCGTVLTNYKNI